MIIINISFQIIFYKCIVTSIVLATIAIVVFLSQKHKDIGMGDYVELTMNESLIEEQILIK